MNKVVESVKNLVTGGESDELQRSREQQDRQAAVARDQQQIALARQQQQLQAEGADADQRVGRASRVQRGRRLLLAATGEGGISGKLGG